MSVHLLMQYRCSFSSSETLCDPMHISISPRLYTVLNMRRVYNMKIYVEASHSHKINFVAASQHS